MPVISMFYGIIIRMFYFDTDKHKAPPTCSTLKRVP